MPSTNRQAMNCQSEPAVADNAVAAASRNDDPTMTRRRPIVSASRPTKGANRATATVGAVTVRPTWNVEA